MKGAVSGGQWAELLSLFGIAWVLLAVTKDE